MHIEYDSVGLTHGTTEILRNISFTISPGERAALVGGSGAGKSTISRLLYRSLDPTAGEIRINNIGFQKYKLSSVLRHVGVILQRSEIVSGDVRENVLLALSQEDQMGITDEAIWNVLDAISPSFRQRFSEHGLDTLVGKLGMQLSGGEQQRLCIARALIKKPELLIIDEATASLDSETEKVVQEGIDAALAENISALVVAHRFSTLRNCTKFMVLKKLADCKPDEPQIEAICNSAAEAYECSPTFRQLSDLQGFKP